mgnify:CR=1 FL=1
MNEVLQKMGEDSISAVQIGYEIIRVTFLTLAAFRQAKSKEKVDLFGVPCSILGGGPPPTTVHVFDFPFEGSDQTIVDALRDFGAIKGIRRQKYISKPNVFNGTRMVTMIIKDTPPRFLEIGGYRCRTWFRGQPLVCNLCMDPGHKSADCPDKDKCRKCKQPGHFARQCTAVEECSRCHRSDHTASQCTNAWGGSRAPVEPSPPLEEENPSPPSDHLSSNCSPPPEETPLSVSDSEESALSEDPPADDSGSESENFEDVAESEVGYEVAIPVARSTEFDKEPDPEVSSPVTILVSKDCLSPEDSANDASTPVPSAVEEDQSSAMSDDSSDVPTMDDLSKATCAPRKRRHGSDDSGDESCIAAKVTIASPDEPPPLPGEVSAELPASSVVDSLTGAPAPEQDSQVIDSPDPVPELPLPVGSAPVVSPPS